MVASQGTHNGFDLRQLFALGEMFNCPGFKLTLVIKKPEIDSPTMPEIGIGVSVSPRWHAVMGWYPMVCDSIGSMPLLMETIRPVPLWMNERIAWPCLGHP